MIGTSPGWEWLLLGALMLLCALMGCLLALWWMQRSNSTPLSIHVSNSNIQPASTPAPSSGPVFVSAGLPATATLPEAVAPASPSAPADMPQQLSLGMAQQLVTPLQVALTPLLTHALDEALQQHMDERLNRLVRDLHESAQTGLQRDPEGSADTAALERLSQVHAQLAEQEQLTFSVSHDLRAPIRVVEGFARILKEDYGHALDRIGLDHIDRILGASARMNGMIDAVLTLARLSSQPLQQQPVNLSQLARYVIDDLQRASPQRQAQIDIAPDLMCHGDPTLLRVLLENLLGNAWKYSARQAHTHIVFDVSERRGGDPIYRISDNGAGFDMRFADRLFGVFQRLHSASDFQGTGVGLASVRRIVRRHGGDIWAESTPGEGARFYFTLAATASALPQSPAAPSAPD
ncbi:sensor histidine kinase [Amphibiibacter pelophylacis]|uniref:ATP-binding protein n=1 Tax=Amphibiibacter pelophylacis TaxID=1799477 RepID=A0ACC6P0C7_9BURK